MLITNPPVIPDNFILQEWLRQVREFLVTTTTATLDFPNTAANSNADLTVTLKGVKPGDSVIATPPSAIEASVIWCAFISANDTVTVRVHTYGAGAVNPASGVWRITVMKY